MIRDVPFDPDNMRLLGAIQVIFDQNLLQNLVKEFCFFCHLGFIAQLI
jgi:hypothetical protein